MRNSASIKKSVSLIQWILLGASILVVLRIGRSLLLPLVMAVFVGYVVKILTDGIAKILAKILPRIFKEEDDDVEVLKDLPFLIRLAHGVRRSVAFIVSLGCVVAMLYFTSRIIMTNVNQVADVLPGIQHSLEHKTRGMLAWIPWHEPLSLGSILDQIDIASITRTVVLETTGFFSKSSILIIYLLFIFLEHRSFNKKLSVLVDDSERLRKTKLVIKKIDRDIRKYLAIKTAMSLITAILSYVIFISVDLKFASFWAFLVFLFNFVPTIGSIVSTALPSLFALIMLESTSGFLVVLIGVFSLQMIIGNIIEPKIQGDNLNLSPLAILLSLALWNMLWGIPGMFLCVPMTVIALIVMSRFESTKSIAIMLSRDGDIKKIIASDTVELPAVNSAEN